MRDIVKEYQKKFRRNHQRARRYTASAPDAILRCCWHWRLPPACS